MISVMQGGTQAQTVKGTSKRIVVEVNMDYLLKMYSTDIDAFNAHVSGKEQLINQYSDTCPSGSVAG
jgi:hypothetical protein